MGVSNLTIEWLHEDRVLYVKMVGDLDDNSFLEVDDVFHIQRRPYILNFIFQRVK